MDTDGTDAAGAVTRGRSLESDVDGCWRRKGIGGRRAALAQWAGPARTYRPDGTGLPPGAGSPAARNSRVFSRAPAVGEKAHRSTIMPPSPVAMARDRCDLAVLLKSITSTSRYPSPPHRIDEVQQQTRRIKLLQYTGTSRDYPVTVLLFSSPMSWNTSPSTEFAGNTRKPCKTSTVVVGRNALHNRKPRWGLGSRAIHGM